MKRRREREPRVRFAATDSWTHEGVAIAGRFSVQLKVHRPLILDGTTCFRETGARRVISLGRTEALAISECGDDRPDASSYVRACIERRTCSARRIAGALSRGAATVRIWASSRQTRTYVRATGAQTTFFSVCGSAVGTCATAATKSKVWLWLARFVTPTDSHTTITEEEHQRCLRF